MTLCLAHDVDTNRPQCPHANQCQRNIALRARDFPNDSTITGSVCSSNDYLLFVPICEVAA